MAQAQLTENCEITTGETFGRMCLNNILKSDLPAQRAACIKSFSKIGTTDDLVNLMYTGTFTMAITKIMLPILEPIAAIVPIAKIRTGKA